MAERFYVIATRGYSNPGNSRQGVSFAVLDSAYCHREVFSAYAVENSGGAGHASFRLRLCEREAARFSALDAAGMPA